MNPLDTPTASRASAPVLAPAITTGFATAVAMWIVGYLTHLPGLRTPAALVGALLIAVHLLGGAIAGRAGGARFVGASALSGVITGLVNLLVLGAVLVDPEQTNALRPGAPVAMGGYLLFSLAAGIAGAFMGRGVLRGCAHAEADTQTWLARFGVVTVGAAIPVLFSGGLVTSANAGLAVVDWPTSFQANMFLFPLSRMTGGAGIYYEHAHRLFGSLVGLVTLVLLIFTVIVDRRRWAQVSVAIAFGAVVLQGVLGGTRVTSATPTETASVDNAQSLALAAGHGVFAQLFFAFLCVNAAFLSRSWRTAEVRPERRDSTLRRLTLSLLIVMIIQLSLGSATRHFAHAHAAFAHTGFSLVVLLFAALAGFRAQGRHKEEPVLRRCGAATAHSVMTQMLLGGITLFMVMPFERGKVDPPAAVIVATAHQAVGALLLAVSTLLFAWTRRLTRRESDHSGAAPDMS